MQHLSIGAYDLYEHSIDYVRNMGLEQEEERCFRQRE